MRWTNNMRILIDLRWMIPGKSGGLEDTAYCFLERLLARTDNQVTLIVPSELIDRFRTVVPTNVVLRSRDNLISDIVRIARLQTWIRKHGSTSA